MTDKDFLSVDLPGDDDSLDDPKDLLEDLDLSSDEDSDFSLPDLSDDESAPDSEEKASSNVFNKLKTAQNIHETVRDLLFKDLDLEDEEIDPETGEKIDGYQLVRQKRRELYHLLDNIDEQLRGKDVKEVTAVFSSLLDINNQLCTQKTDGVIAIRTRLFQFFAPKGVKPQNVQPALRQEISLIFSPEEISSVRTRLANMDYDDPLKPFFTMILDQAYDIVQYSEMTGYLLLEMTNYFLHKLDEAGYSDTPKVAEFKERRERAKMSLEKAIDDLKHVESLVQSHMHERPVLLELPKLLRALIQVKIGIMDKKSVPKILQQVQARLGDYARARSAVAFDFNRVPGFQHSVRLRQSIILNLHMDMLKYMGEVFEGEFRAVQKELEALAKDIEAATATMDPNSPEYQEMLKQKMALQQKIEMQRRRMDVLKSQQKLVDVQHNMIGQAIQRYKDNEAIHQRLDEQMANRTSIDTNTPSQIRPMAKKKISRMVMGAKRRGD